MVAKTKEKFKNQNKHSNQTGNGAILSDADIEIIRIVGPEKFYGVGKGADPNSNVVYFIFCVFVYYSKLTFFSKTNFFCSK
jgi:hypothetical protein